MSYPDTPCQKLDQNQFCFLRFMIQGTYGFNAEGTECDMKDNQFRKTSWFIGSIAAVGLIGVILPGSVSAAEITVYKSPWCGCCSKWVDHMRANGHTLKTVNVENLDLIKKMAGVPKHLQSCHTAKVDGYTIEGHVPAPEVARLLKERPVATGLAVAGMPGGAPGMEGGDPEAYDVTLFGPNGTREIYKRY